jgi:archaellum component FlaD/FlaE
LKITQTSGRAGRASSGASTPPPPGLAVFKLVQGQQNSSRITTQRGNAWLTVLDRAYISAPIRGHSDDSTDETYAPSTCIQEEDDEGDDADTEAEPQNAVYYYSEEEEDDEDEEEDDEDEEEDDEDEEEDDEDEEEDDEDEDEDDEDEEEDEDEDDDMEDSPCVLPTVERHYERRQYGFAGPSRVSTSASNWRAQNSRGVQKRGTVVAATRPPRVWRETPVKNPYLKKIADEAARRAAPPRRVRRRTGVGAGRFGLRRAK